MPLAEAVKRSDVEKCVLPRELYVIGQMRANLQCRVNFYHRSDCDSRLLWCCELAPVTFHKMNTHLYLLAKALDAVAAAKR